MAGLCACQSPFPNLLLIGKDEFAQAISGAALTNNNSTSSHTFVVAIITTSTPVSASIYAKLVVKYTKTDLQRANQLAIELFV